MDARRLTTLGLVTVLVVSGAGLALRNRAAAVEPERVEGLLLEELDERVNDAAGVTLTQGDWTLVAALETDAAGEAQWVMPDKGGFPIDFEKLRKAVVAASNLELREAMTARPEHYAKLGVDDSAPRLTVRDASGAVLADVYLGERKGTDGLYARRADTDQSWLVRGRVDLPPSELDWVDKQVLQLDADRVLGVELTHPDGEHVRVEKVEGEAQPWRVDDIPAGREQAPAGAASGLGGALAWVSFEDVAPADSVDFSEAVRSRFTLEDGLVVLADLVEREDGAWLRLSAEAEEVVGPVPEPEVAPEVEPEVAENSAAGESDAAAVADVADVAGVAGEAAELNAKHGPWAYRVGEYKAQSLTKRLEDLLAPLPPEVTDTPEDSGTSPSPEAPEPSSESDASSSTHEGHENHEGSDG